MGVLCRESLCILNAVYASAQKHWGHEAPLWPSVVRELEDTIDMMPLIRREWGAQWHDTVVAVDASPGGK